MFCFILSLYVIKFAIILILNFHQGIQTLMGHFSNDVKEEESVNLDIRKLSYFYQIITASCSVIFSQKKITKQED